MTQHPANKRQRGQAMIEFAIILIVLALLTAGGLELAIAAYNGHRTGEGAKAGAVDWSQCLGRSGASGPQCVDPYSPDPSNPILITAGLGDHEALANFRRPSCTSPTDYDDGLPDGTMDANEHGITQPAGGPAGDKVYLYNPLPIDITNCGGMDADYPNRSRVSVLVAGKRDDPDTAAVEATFSGLPNMNQAIYSQYRMVCYNAGPEVDCGDPHDTQLLKLPGWLDPADDTVKLVLYDNNTLWWKPSFRLQCAPRGSDVFGDCDSAAVPLNICWDDTTLLPLPCNARVQLRYRHVFESLVLMGMEGAPDNIDPGDEQYFSTADAPAGVLGSELAQAASTTQPGAIASKLKARKDFLGCYQTTSSQANIAGTDYITSVNVVSSDACDRDLTALP